MKETLLKKEFREKDVQRLRNIVTKKYGNKTANQVGYEKETVDYKEGDVWEDNGKTWTIKDGLKQTITKLDSIKKQVRIPLLCPNCSKTMKLTLDKRMYPIHKKCFDCVVKMETKLRAEGKYEDYMKNVVSNNIITHIEEAEQFIEEFVQTNNSTYVTEHGDVEDWEGGVDKNKIISKWKEELQEMKEAIKK
jgi:hypothetical protein